MDWFKALQSIVPHEQPGLFAGLFTPPQGNGDLTQSLRDRFGMPPASLRTFAETLAGDRSKITEKSFTPEELAILRRTGEAALSAGKGSFGYGDYAPGGEKAFQSDGTGAVIDALTDMPSSLAFTLGMANVRRAPDGGLTINDKYDFSASKERVDALKAGGVPAIAEMLARGYAHNGLLGVGNVLGNLAAPEDYGRDVEINIPRSE